MEPCPSGGSGQILRTSKWRGQDVEGSPGDEEHEGDQAEEYVGSLTSVLLTDGGDRWDLRATEIQLLLRLAEGEVDSEVGHGH